jgi:hypothetical protein
MNVHVKRRPPIRVAENRLRSLQRFARITEQCLAIVFEPLKSLADETTFDSSASDQPTFGY